MLACFSFTREPTCNQARDDPNCPFDQHIQHPTLFVLRWRELSGMKHRTDNMNRHPLLAHQFHHTKSADTTSKTGHGLLHKNNICLRWWSYLRMQVGLIVEVANSALRYRWINGRERIRSFWGLMQNKKMFVKIPANVRPTGFSATSNFQSIKIKFYMWKHRSM